MVRSMTKPNITHNHKGFTLAETLITLVVIGVVAALTIPNIIVQHQKEETVTRLKKVYSSITQSINKAIADHGPVKTWEIEDGQSKEFVEKYMVPYLNVAKICGYESTGDCKFVSSYMNSPVTAYYGNTYYKLLLADGSALFIIVSKRNTVSNNVTIPRSQATVYIDINGHKGPNIQGKDIFCYNYWIQNDWTPVGQGDSSGTFIPSGGTLILGDSRDTFKATCKKNGSGKHCAALIMADNWTIADDYPW